MKDKFRNEMLAEISNALSLDQIKIVARCFDRIAERYDVSRNQINATILSKEEFANIIKIFLVVKSMEGTVRGTLENYAMRLQAFMLASQKPIGQITANDIRLFLFNYQKIRNVSDRTLESIRVSICSFMRWAALEGYIDKDPTQSVKPVRFVAKPRKALSQIELELIRRACKTSREIAIVETLYSTGCRVSELTAIKVGDIDWNKKTVMLFGKGQKYRTGFLNAKAEVSIHDYLSKRKHISEYLFCNDRGGGQMTKDNVERMIKSIAQRAGLGDVGVTPHVFRHTTATQALHNGMPIEAIQQILGHANISTTMIYAHISHDSVQEKHQKYIV